MSVSSKWLPFSLIGLGSLLIIAAVAYPLISQGKSEPASTPVPRQVSGFSLATEATGKAALQEFSQLHGKSFPLSSGARASYGPANQVTLWVAGTTSTSNTRKLLVEMRDKIAEGAAESRVPFQPTGVRNIGNREVYALDGMGQKHFYFQSGKYLIWLAASPEIADQSLKEALNFYR